MNEDFDSDGYPTGDALGSIGGFVGTPKAFVERLADLEGGYGVVSVDTAWRDGRHMNIVSIITRGWSGMEEVIEVIQQTMFHFTFWESSHRGGLHNYHVPSNLWETSGAWGGP